jgi:hypothetical protein
MQSPEVAHGLLHAPPEQMYGEQLMVPLSVQPPMPSQVSALVSTVPLHEAATQVVPAV